MAKILLVDDSKASRSTTLRALRQAGFSGIDIVEAPGGPEAFDIVQAEGPFDLIVTDWDMPELTGKQLVDKLSSPPPVAFMMNSSNCSEERKAQIEKMGAVLILKPVTAADLADKLAPLLG